MSGWDNFLPEGPGASATPTRVPTTDWNTFLGGETKPILPGSPASSGPLSSYLRWPLGLATAAAGGILSPLEIPAATGQQVQQELNPLTNRLLAPYDRGVFATPQGNVPQALIQGALAGPLAPQSEGERLAQAGIAGIGSTVIPTLLTGGGALPIALSGGAGGVGSQAAADLGLPPSIQFATGLASGIGGYGVGSLLNRPQTLEGIASRLGSSQNYDEAGVALREEAQKFRDSLSASGGPIDSAEAAMNAKVPANATGDHSNLVGSLALLRNEGGEPALEANNFLARLSRGGGRLGQTAKDIQGYFDDVDKYNTLGGSVPLIPTVGWPAQRQFRSAIGDWMAKTPSETTAKKLLYGAATDDLGNIASANGAADEFANFNQISRNAHALNDGPISTVLDAPNSGESALRLIRGASRSGDDLSALRGVMPEAVDELAAAHLRIRGMKALPASPTGQAQLFPAEADRAFLMSGRKSPGEPGYAARMLESIGGGELLSRAGGLAAGAMGINPKYGEYIGGLVGQLAPAAWRGAGNMLINPQIPFAGAVGASAPMYIQPTQQ